MKLKITPLHLLSKFFQKKEDIANLRVAIDRLHADFREIIDLAIFQDMKYKEIAEFLKIPIGTVMSRLFNAKQKLKEEFFKVQQGISHVSSWPKMLHS